MRYKAEAAEMVDALHRRATRNVPLAGIYLTIGLIFLVFACDIGTVKISRHQFIPVSGLVTLALAFCFIYAAARRLFVRTSDKAIKVLIEALLNNDADS